MHWSPKHSLLTPDSAFTNRGHSWKVSSWETTQELPHISWNPKVICHVYWRDLILRKLNPVYIMHSFSSIFTFLISLCGEVLNKQFVLYFLTKILCARPLLPQYSRPAHHIPTVLIILTISCKTHRVKSLSKHGFPHKISFDPWKIFSAFNIIFG
jgi:hypothetical protein